MQRILRSLYLCIVILGLMIFAFPHPLLLEPQAAQGSETPEEQSEEVFSAVTSNFTLLASLFNDVTYVADSIYPVVLKADSYQAAIDYLSQGFQLELATAIVSYYLGWDEQLGKMVIIPTDFIPFITKADKNDISIVFINKHNAVLQRIYNQCYAENDSYIYTIRVHKEASGWKISELSLEEIKSKDSVTSLDQVP